MDDIGKLESAHAPVQSAPVSELERETHPHQHPHLIFPVSDGTDTTIFDTEEKRHMAVKDPSLFPDGGLEAWTVVGASFLLVFCTFGNILH